MIIGHRRIWNFLIGSARQNKLAHAYLFLGPAQTGKKTLAVELARWLLCSNKEPRPCGRCLDCRDMERGAHPDFFILQASREEKDGILKILEIGIGEIRALQHKLKLSPYRSKYKIAVVDEISSLSRDAANSFLKTLEEPSPGTLIFLISSFAGSLLPTIVSRCQTIKFLPVPQKEIIEALKTKFKTPTLARNAVRLAAGRPGRAMDFSRRPELLESQEENFELLERLMNSDLASRFEAARELGQNTVLARETLYQWLLWTRDNILAANNCPELLLRETGRNAVPVRDNLFLAREIEKTLQILGNSSFNARLALEILMTKIIKN